MLLHLDFDIHSRRQSKVHQGVNRLGRRAYDINQPLMHAHFILLPGVLMNKGRAIDRVLFDFGRQGYGADNLRAVAASRLDNLAHRGVNYLVVVGADADTDTRFYFFLFDSSHFLLAKELGTKARVPVRPELAPEIIL